MDQLQSFCDLYKLETSPIDTKESLIQKLSNYASQQAQQSTDATFYFSNNENYVPHKRAAKKRASKESAKLDSTHSMDQENQVGKTTVFSTCHPEKKSTLSTSKTSKTTKSNKSTTIASQESLSDNSTIPPSKGHTSPPTNNDQPLAYREFVQSLFAPPQQINEYWKDILLNRIDKPSAKQLVYQLDSSQCPMGYNPQATPLDSTITVGSTTPSQQGKKGSLLAFVRDQKALRDSCVALTRVGDFYEAYGIDAILLVEFCGLNPMGSKARAGCPYRNVQATLDGLTAAGFSVAVLEEAGFTENARLKNRFLAQIVSPASPTYLYDLVLGTSNAESLSSSTHTHNYVGIIHQAVGYSLVEVNWEERMVKISERLTQEAIACRLAAYPPVEPVFYMPIESEVQRVQRNGLSWLTSRKDTEATPTPLSLKLLSSNLIESPTGSSTDAHRFKKLVVNAILNLMGPATTNATTLSDEDFQLVQSHMENESFKVITQPLHKETATQLGLLSNPTIPSLIHAILPHTAPAATRHFLRRWLLIPPPPDMADAMAHTVGYLKKSTDATLPPLHVLPMGKVVSLIHAGQASAHIFREVRHVLHTTLQILETPHLKQHLIPKLLSIVQHESGYQTTASQLHVDCIHAMHTIDRVVRHLGDPHQVDQVSDFNPVPRAFFERNEITWRGRVKREVAHSSYANVDQAAEQLSEAIRADFIRDDQAAEKLIVQDIFNNLLAIKSIPAWATTKAQKDTFYHPRDRNGKVLKNRYTTDSVSLALSNYVEACQEACGEITNELTRLSKLLVQQGCVPTILQSSHANLILSAAVHHASHANTLGWNLATLQDDSSETAANFQQLWPYWMDRSESVSNTFDLNGLFLLTAPNMSGKSTLMRSAAAAALLSACGLCAPLAPKSWIQRFDCLFVRGASADVPSENKSAFGAEMGDVAALLRSCGSNSLVFVDELGRGTSPRDGTSLAGAVLEEMATLGMTGFFATHLHDILDLPLHPRASERIFKKRMMTIDDGMWTYKMEDGVCTDSLAMKTAARFGLPSHIIDRAHYFAVVKDQPSNTIQSEKVVSHPTKFQDNLKEPWQILEQLAHRSVCTIPSGYISPPTLDCGPCVYILDFGKCLYVGETRKLSQRLEQHRKGPRGSNFITLATNVNSKDEARNLESRLIRSLSQRGFRLLSVVDGMSVSSIANPNE